MSNILRQELIKLAKDHPELRGHLVPLIKGAGVQVVLDSHTLDRILKDIQDTWSDWSEAEELFEDNFEIKEWSPQVRIQVVQKKWDSKKQVLELKVVLTLSSVVWSLKTKLGTVSGRGGVITLPEMSFVYDAKTYPWILD